MKLSIELEKNKINEDFSFTDAELQDKFNRELVDYIKQNQKAFEQAQCAEDMTPNPTDPKLLAIDKKLTLADAKQQIRNLKVANKALQDAHPKGQTEKSRDLLVDGQKRLSFLLQSLESNYLSQPKYKSLEQRIFDMETQFAKQKLVCTEHVAFVELEAFKHAIREETITIADFKIANIKREMIERMVKIEARNKELGDECSEIIPRRIFNEYVGRQHDCQDEIKTIMVDLLPGIELRQNLLIHPGMEMPKDLPSLGQRRVDDMVPQLQTLVQQLSQEIKSINRTLNLKHSDLDNRLNQVEKNKNIFLSQPQPIQNKRKGHHSNHQSQSISSADSIVSKRLRSNSRSKQSSPNVHVAFGSTVHPEESQHKRSQNFKQSNRKISIQEQTHLREQSPTPVQNRQYLTIHKTSNTVLESQSSVTQSQLQVKVEQLSEEQNRYDVESFKKSNQNAQSAFKISSNDTIKSKKQDNDPPNNSRGKSESTIQSRPKVHEMLTSGILNNLIDCSSSDSQESVKRGMNDLQLTQRQVIKLKANQRKITLQLSHMQAEILHQKSSQDKLEGRVRYAEQVDIDLTTAVKMFQRQIQSLKDQLMPLSEDYAKITTKVDSIEADIIRDRQIEILSPKDQNKRQRYMERRIILTEQEIGKLYQEISLHKIERKIKLDELQRKTSDALEFKREFAVKSDFLFDQIQHTTRTSLVQIEEFGRQLIEIKRTIKEKMINLSKQTQLFQVELERTQNINRNLVQEKAAPRGLESSHFSRQTEVGSASNPRNTKILRSHISKQQDSLGFDSVMSSNGEHDDKRMHTIQAPDKYSRFVTSVDVNRKSSFKYTARAVPPLTVGDIQKIQNSTHTGRDFVMLEDSINSQISVKPKTTIQNTRDKVRDIIVQSQQIRSQRSQRQPAYQNDVHLKQVNQPVQKMELEKFSQSFN